MKASKVWILAINTIVKLEYSYKGSQSDLKYRNLPADPEWVEVACQQGAGSESESLGPADIVKRIGVVEFRAQLNATFKLLAANLGTPLTAGITVADREIPVEDGFITLRSYIPQHDSSLGEDKSVHFPLFSWTYGGGFWSGNLDSDDIILRELAVEYRIVIISTDYRKAPEFPFPTPLNDVYSGIRWVITHKEEFLVDTTKGFIIGGLSAGGNLAAVATRRAINDPGIPSPTGQVLLIPTLIDPTCYPEKFKDLLLSLDQNSDAPGLCKRKVLWAAEMYYGSHGSDPDASPLLTPLSELARLPPAYFQICGLDPLRDDAFLYEQLLKKCMIPTKVDVYPGLPHWFQFYHPELEASRKQRNDLKEGLRWLLFNSKNINQLETV
ncbi:Alpha/Beta hydrolase protein [Hysterangium stoloniferum]|nr:Alpha/Beta hydrolase protein [Hysterangium stoloniferum]